MSSTEDLVAQLQPIARMNRSEDALRCLRATASTVADWGGDATAKVLREKLPAELLKGAGSSGRSWEAARKLARVEGDTVVLFEETGRRMIQPDPGKVVQATRAALGLLKALLSADEVERVAQALPEPVAADFREASTGAPWGYGLIPQSYARPG